MSLDERIKSLARQEVAKALAPTELIVGDAADGPGLISRLDDLHHEVHALATRLTALEQQQPVPPGATVETPPETAPRTRRPRKATEE